MINWARASQLQEEVGPEDFDDVVALFLEEVEAVIIQLHKLKDRSTLGEKLHFLKGSALSLGFSDFSDLCGAGEREADAGNAKNVDIPTILDTYAKSKELFLAEYSQRLAA